MIANGPRRRRILLDSNVLLLLYVGRFDRDRIQKFKNTAQFTSEDFDLLRDFIGRFNEAVTTAHVLTEVSNLSGQLAEPTRSIYFAHFAKQIPLLVDLTVASSLAAADLAFARLGLTDAAIAVLAKEQRVTVLTVDAPLYVHLLAVGVEVFNFNHLRSARMIPES